jgi:hypothetical protein
MRKKKQIPNPHDAFFRQTLQRPGVAAEFLRLYLPEDIVAQLDLSRVTLEDGSFVDEKLREHFSDLLYRVGLRGGGDAFVFFLLEPRRRSAARYSRRCQKEIKWKQYWKKSFVNPLKLDRLNFWNMSSGKRNGPWRRQ